MEPSSVIGMPGALTTSIGSLTSSKNALQRTAKNRTYGDTLNTPPPLHAHEWMKGGTAANNNGPQSDEIFSSSDETENNRTD